VLSVRQSFRGRLRRRQFISQRSTYCGSHRSIKIVGPLFWSFGGLGSSDLLLKFEMPCSDVTQEIGCKGVAHVPRHFKAAFGLVAMMAGIVHRAMLPQFSFLFDKTLSSLPERLTMPRGRSGQSAGENIPIDVQFRT
jgi:hypothetical protein